MSLWSDIKQRRITQIFLSYLVGGWLILQVVDQVVDREVLPRYVYVVALILFAFGIPAALVIGWNHGEKGAQKAPLGEIVFVALLVLAAGASSTVVVRSALQAAALENAEWDLSTTGVLYFGAADPEARLVADGLTEDLIDRLSRVPELDVLSRNGSRALRQQMESDGMSSLEAAREAGLGTFLTGYVERAGGEYRVSVTVQDQSGVSLPGGDISLRASEDEVLALRDQAAEEVASTFREVLGSEIRLRQNRTAAPNEGAWLSLTRADRAIERGTDAVVARDGRAAIASFEEAGAALEDAVAAAPDWAAPWVSRARLAYEMNVLADSFDELAAYLARTEEMADEALSRDPAAAEALTLRGVARYSRYVYGLDHTPEDRAATLEAAQADLERATELERTLAEPYATLSHLYYQTGDVANAALAAQRAYENDAFLRSTDAILRRLFTTNYDLQRVQQARNWCDEGHRRFPENFLFTECELWMMTLEGVTPDPALAWELADSVAELAGEREAYARAGAEIVVGGVLARAGLADSASAVMSAARPGPDVDSEGELLSVEAAMRLLNGEAEEALVLLQRYTSLNAGHFSQGRGLHWWWRNLEGNPEFERLRRLN